VTYRFATDPIATGPFSLGTSGSLAGLAQSANLAWLETLMAKHALAREKHRHRLRSDNALNFAYRFSNALIVLMPENSKPYVILAMHPSYCSGGVPRELTDSTPTHLAFRTFGVNPNALNLAINLFIVETLLNKLGM
jgi:hypothetical protein